MSAKMDESIDQGITPHHSRRETAWLNPKLLVGLAMVLSMGMMGIVGGLFWDLKLARVASAPLNLPPPWAPGFDGDIETEMSHASVGRKSPGALTGANPFKMERKASDSGPTSLQARGFGHPSWKHPVGTESNGRDMLAVLLVGTPRSLRIGLIAAGIGMGVGIILGFTAGFMGGWIDNLIRTISDAVITIPSMAELIVISAYVRQVSVENMGLLLALFAWPGPTRLIRAQVLSMREHGYVRMAQLSGVPTFGIMFKEMMPNLLPYLAASFTGNVSATILAATGLEALGLGPTRIPTLGMTIFYAIRAAGILRGMWWWWGVPIAALVVIFAGLFLMTIGLDEVANPRLRGARTT